MLPSLRFLLRPILNPYFRDKMSIFKKDFICLLLERRERREKGRETAICQRYIHQLHLAHLHPGDPAHNPGTSPNQELNW